MAGFTPATVLGVFQNNVPIPLQAVYIFFQGDISNKDFFCAPRIGDEVMPIGSKIRSWKHHQSVRALR